MGKRVCIYCSSSDILEDKYREVAQCFAKAASLLNYTIVCGGSCKGLLGVIIDTMIEAGARVEGVVPGFMKELEFHHPKLANIEIVSTMSQRKEMLREDTDAVVAFPGGLGTLEELLVTSFPFNDLCLSGDVIISSNVGFFTSIFLFLNFLKSNVLYSYWKEGFYLINIMWSWV